MTEPTEKPRNTGGRPKKGDPVKEKQALAKAKKAVKPQPKPKPEGYVFGRPTKYEPRFCQMVVEHMAEGASLTSFAASIDVDRDTITRWTNEHQDFSLAAKRGKVKCAAWWERVNRTNAQTNRGNSQSIQLGLKNMAPEDWRERQEVDLSGSVAVTKIVRQIVK